jgi:heme A synthase
MLGIRSRRSLAVEWTNTGTRDILNSEVAGPNATRGFIGGRLLPRGGISTKIDRRRFLQVVAILGALFAYSTIVLGGTVRGMGAGLACPDWPLCNGHVIPPLDDPLVAVEYAHRMVAALTSLFLLLTLIVAFVWFRADRSLLTLSLASMGLLVTQVGFGALTITSSLDWVIVTIHLAFGTATFASALSVAFFALRPTSIGMADAQPVE